MLFLRGCSRLVHHIDTTTSMVGLILASNAPRMNRKTASPAKLWNASFLALLRATTHRQDHAACSPSKETEAKPSIYRELNQRIHRKWLENELGKVDNRSEPAVLLAAVCQQCLSNSAHWRFASFANPKIDAKEMADLSSC